MFAKVKGIRLLNVGRGDPMSELLVGGTYPGTDMTVEELRVYDLGDPKADLSFAVLGSDGKAHQYYYHGAYLITHLVYD